MVRSAVAVCPHCNVRGERHESGHCSRCNVHHMQPVIYPRILNRAVGARVPASPYIERLRVYTSTVDPRP